MTEVTEAILDPSAGHRVLHGTSSGGRQAGLCLSEHWGCCSGLDSFVQLPVPQQWEGPGGRGRGVIAPRT